MEKNKILFFSAELSVIEIEKQQEEGFLLRL